MPLVIMSLVWPPVLDVMSESESTKDAWYEPVR